MMPNGCPAFLLVSAMVVQAAQPMAPNLAGDWQGSLQVSGVRVRVLLHFQQSGGRWTGTLDSPDQQALGLPLSAIQGSGEAWSFRLPVAQASFQGSLDAQGSTLRGTWTQGAAVPVSFTRSLADAGPRRPQKPQPPFPYEISEVSFPSGSLTLVGTLTRLKGPGKGPGVVLVHGSGPLDRDEALKGHQPFLVLADYLTRQGITVLRYDKRGIGESSGSYATATTLDFAEDAKAALAFLAAQPGVDGRRVGLLGHSEGGLVAPMVASATRQAAFIVLLASPAVPGEAVLLAQGELMLKVQGASPATLAAQRKSQLILFKAALDGTPTAIATAREQLLAEVPAEARTVAAGQVDIELTRVCMPWFRTFLTLDPRSYLRQVKQPILALFGEKDLQVPPSQSEPELAKALKDNADAQIRVMPALNHLFQTAGTGAVSEYAAIEETMAPAALEAISGWILTHSGRP